MTVTTGEKYDAEVSADDFMAAEEPPDPEAAGEEEAPYGWTRDRQTGQLRPRAKPGRPKNQPVPETMPPDAEPVARAQDKAPAASGTGRGKTSTAVPPMPRGGILAAGIDKLYRRAGRVVRAMDYDIGTAMIECATKDPAEPDEMTTGEAWEALCKVNPRIRAFWMRAVSGGAWGDLVMAHLPIGLALLTKPWVQRLIPFERVVESVAEPDETTPDGEGGLPGGMTAADFGQMKDMAEQQARRMAEKMGMTVSDEQMAEASAAAAERFGAAQIPPGLRRQQPQRRSRAGRRG